MNQDKPSLLLPIMWTGTAVISGVNAVLRIMYQMESVTDRITSAAVFALALGCTVYYWIRYAKRMKAFKGE